MSEWSFISHITDYLTRPRFGEQKAPTVWPSSATGMLNEKPIGKCRRQAFFRYASDNYRFSEDYAEYKKLHEHLTENKLPISRYTQWLFRQGDLYEEYCVNLAKEAGVFIATQTSIYIPRFNVSGKLDLIVINPDTSNYHIVEVKSVYGFNSNFVLGTDAQQKRGIMGQPRDSHLMQLGIYQWWFGNTTDNFGPGLLVYGSRDTGRFGEYQITVEKDESDSLEYIYYQGIAPVVTEKTNSGISIKSIMENYDYVLTCLKDKVIPERDYEILYSEEKIKELYEAGDLSKADTLQYEKRLKQQEEGKKRIVKAVEKGDWQCRFCDYKTVCYTKDSEAVSLDELLQA